jgi:hypothetical protein
MIQTNKKLDLMASVRKKQHPIPSGRSRKRKEAADLSRSSEFRNRATGISAATLERTYYIHTESGPEIVAA